MTEQERNDRPDVDAAPKYADLFAARHRAHRDELRRILSELPWRPTDAVLDVPCGDGFYTNCFTQLLGAGGTVVGVDASREYLGSLEEPRPHASCRCVRLCGDAYHLPLADESFDLVWCAHSLLTLRQPGRALREFRRVLKPGGVVGLLEQDRMHDVVLNWPAEVELAVQHAERIAMRSARRSPGRLYVGRHMQKLLREAGFEPVMKKTYTVDRYSPLGDDDREFLQRHLRELRRRVLPHLTEERRRQLDALTSEAAGAPLWERPDLEMSVSDILFLGRK